MITVFYNEKCAFCKKKAEWIHKKDIHNKIKLIDINEKPWYLALADVDIDDAMNDLHVMSLSDGEIYVGVDAMLAIFDALGYKKTVNLARLRPFRYLCSATYYLINTFKHVIPA